MPDYTTSNPDALPEDIPQLYVSVGEVSTDDNDYFEPSAMGDGIWNDYVINNKYEHDNHVYMLPITAPGGFQGDSVAFCQLAHPTVLWIADWTACRTGKPPTMPHYNVIDPNVVLLDAHFEPATIETLADGKTRRYRVTGTYVYGFKNPGKALQIFGKPPYMADKDEARYLDQGDFKKNIIDVFGFASSGPTESAGIEGDTGAGGGDF